MELLGHGEINWRLVTQKELKKLQKSYSALYKKYRDVKRKESNGNDVSGDWTKLEGEDFLTPKLYPSIFAKKEGRPTKS